MACFGDKRRRAAALPGLVAIGLAQLACSLCASCILPAVLVALERVHSGAHYPSDVAAGAVIGLAAARSVHVLPGLTP
jgi:membrane-associated phospholipid phosphatase